MDKAPEAFRTISEVAEDLDVPQHVLRFWESRFNQIRPMKRGGGRRYYRPDDVALLRGIRHLLYGQGYTIRGVQRILREQGIHFVQAAAQDGAGLAEPDDYIEAAPAIEEEITVLPSNAAERREPTFDVPEAGSHAREPAATRPQAPTAASPATRGGLGAEARAALKSTLDGLAECRRLLDAAIAEQA